MLHQATHASEGFKHFQQPGTYAPIQMQTDDTPTETDLGTLSGLHHVGSGFFFSPPNRPVVLSSISSLSPSELAASSPYLGQIESKDLMQPYSDSALGISETDTRYHDFLQYTNWLRLAELEESIDLAFSQIAEESAESGHDAPPEDVIQEARRIVFSMFQLWPREYDIYPMDEQRVAIEVDGGFGRRMLLVCETGGSALCAITVNRISRRARYDDSSILPDGFLFDALRDISHEVMKVSSASKGK